MRDSLAITQPMPARERSAHRSPMLQNGAIEKATVWVLSFYLLTPDRHQQESHRQAEKGEERERERALLSDWGYKSTKKRCWLLGGNPRVLSR